MCTVETDFAIVVDVWMEHSGNEFDAWSFGGILLSEFQFELK